MAEIGRLSWERYNWLAYYASYLYLERVQLATKLGKIIHKKRKLPKMLHIFHQVFDKVESQHFTLCSSKCIIVPIVYKNGIVIVTSWHVLIILKRSLIHN